VTVTIGRGGYYSCPTVC